MSDTDSRASRRVMNQLGEPSRIPVVNVAEADVGLLIGLPIAGLILGTVTGVDVLAIPLMALGLCLGVAIVYASPPHLDTVTWGRDLLRYYLQRPRFTRNASPDAETSTAGGPVEYTPFEPDERTQDLTAIERAWPGAGAIERSDGRMEAFIELEPSNMDFAMSGDWAAIQRAATQFANDELAGKLTFHVTTRSFPVDRLVEQLEERQSDPDMQNNDTFAALLEEYREQRPAELADTQSMRFYLGVEVSRFDVYDRREHGKTPAQRLREFPVVGLLVQPFVTRTREFSDAELRAAMFDRLDDRIRTLRSEFVEEVPDWSARRLSTVELFALGMDFWSGEEFDRDRLRDLLSEREPMDRSERGEGN